MKIHFSAVSLVLATLVSLSSAQTTSNRTGLDSLSIACRDYFSRLVDFPSGRCANAAKLFGFLSTPGSAIQPFDSFIRGLCAQNCSPDGFPSVKSLTDGGCLGDQAAFNPIASILYAFGTSSGYKAIKDALCNPSASGFCITDLLTSVQASTGRNVTVDSITDLITGNLSLLLSLPAPQLCSDCGTGLVVGLRGLDPIIDAGNQTFTEYSSNFTHPLAEKCGGAWAVSPAPTATSRNAGESMKVEKLVTGIAIGSALAWFWL